MTLATDLLYASKSRGLDDPIWSKPSANANHDTQTHRDQKQKYIQDCEDLFKLIGSRRLTIAELAKDTGITPETTNKRIQSLILEGKIVRAVSKPPYRYYQNPNYRADKH